MVGGDTRLDEVHNREWRWERAMRCKYVMAVVLLVCSAAGIARGAESDVERETAAVRAAGKKYVAAMRRGDSEALRKMWTREGDYVDARGNYHRIRRLLSQDENARPAEGDVADVKVEDSTIRFITPDVAIEDGVSGETASSDGGSVIGRYTAVWVKRDGDWLLDSLRESEVASPAAKDRLHELDWLIGEWVGKTEDGAILVSSHFRDDGRYIVREFVDRGDNHATVTGTQRIGWDAATRKIKCWTFDSQGGTGEGTWRRDGNRWIVEMADVLPGGEKTTVSAVYVPAGDGRFVWESGGAKLDGERVPPRRVEFKRADD
jgi:uncharacterized protein (TIGR02246 family)